MAQPDVVVIIPANSNGESWLELVRSGYIWLDLVGSGYWSWLELVRAG